MAEEKDELGLLRGKLSATDYIMEPHVGKTVMSYVRLGTGYIYKLYYI